MCDSAQRLPSGGTRGTTPPSVPRAFAGCVVGIYTQHRRGLGDWLRLGDKAKVIWLDIADYRFSCVCLMCHAKAQVDQSWTRAILPSPITPAVAFLFKSAVRKYSHAVQSPGL